jgi:hypothetical protein
MSFHQCQPAEPVAAFCHVCGTCGKEIGPVDCWHCLGTGDKPHVRPRRACEVCNGEGSRGWEPVEAKQ